MDCKGTSKGVIVSNQLGALITVHKPYSVCLLGSKPHRLCFQALWDLPFFLSVLHTVSIYWKTGTGPQKRLLEANPGT